MNARGMVAMIGLVAMAMVAGTASAESQPLVRFDASDDAALARTLLRGGITYSSLARVQSDSAWRWGDRHRLEPALCVASGSYAFGVAANGKPWIVVLQFAVSGPQAARLSAQDSVSVSWRDSVCGDSLPSWHGHIIEDPSRYKPSDCDLHMAAKRPTVVFHLVQGDTGRVSAFWPNRDVVERYSTDTIQWCP